MAVKAGNVADWGKTAKGFAQVLLDAGQTVTKSAAKKLGEACQETIEALDDNWKRGRMIRDTYSVITGQKGKAYAYKSGYRGGSEDYPWYTGNLHDSVAVGVADGRRLLEARYMEPAATETQTYRGMPVNGSELGPEALARAVNTFSSGIGGLRAIVVVGVPYADEVNHSDAHYDFISEFSDYLIGNVEGALGELRKQSFKMK